MFRHCAKILLVLILTYGVELFSFERWEIWGSERWHQLLEVTQMTSVTDSTWTQIILFLSCHVLWPLCLRWDQWSLTAVIFAPFLGDSWQCQNVYLVVHRWGGCVLLQGLKARAAAHHPAKHSSSSKMSTMLRLGDPAAGPHPFTTGIWKSVFWKIICKIYSSYRP
jgi:hypothetical protein